MDAVFAELSLLSGTGSQSARQGLLAGLLGCATPSEQEFLVGLITYLVSFFVGESAEEATAQRSGGAGVMYAPSQRLK